MSENRPYRVGMARAAQRYIEPDEIYEDLSRGKPARIPARFPFTWNPVNGLGHVGGGGLAGPVDDLFQAIVDTGKSAAGNVVDVGKGQAGDEAQKATDAFFKTAAGKVLQDKIKQKAAEGVTGVVKKQAPNLIMLGVAAGAIGGTLSSKMGKTGTAIAIGVAFFAVYQLLTVSVDDTPAKK